MDMLASTVSKSSTSCIVAEAELSSAPSRMET